MLFSFKFDGNGDIYLDNIYFSSTDNSPPVPVEAAPTPTIPAEGVISIFSDAYDNVEGTDFNPDWGQSTVYSEVSIDDNATILYAGLNYQGIQLAANQDVSGMEYLHLDFWTANSSDLGVFLISPGPVETEYVLVPPGETETWVSVDIPLSAFDPVDLADIFQFKFEGNGDIYLDNIYFTDGLTSIDEVAGTLPSAYTLEQNYPNPFNPTTKIKFTLPVANQVTLTVYNMLGQQVATLVDGFVNAGTYEAEFDAARFASGTYIYSITAGDFTAAKKMLLMK